MPTPTPIALIKPANRLFATIDIDTHANVFTPGQLPSTYYMTGAGPFLRLRPLHRSGFGMFERPTRVVGLYTGTWVSGESFEENRDDNDNILFSYLGDNATDITAAIATLKLNAKTTQEIIDQNAAVHRPDLNNSIVYVDSGPLEGSVFGGDQVKTNNYYRPMKVVDATAADRNAHTGHAFASSEAAETFYGVHYPALLDQLMQLGQSAQVIKTDMSPRGVTVETPIQTDLQYYPEAMFENRAAQLNFLKRLYMSFV
ncbi:hypothetical protein IG617_16985 [Labrenzia polysiphoniae]|uniref:Uncharacterized protein n=2 Tax=Roseibium polysiphoniae TaxID=2571221 RepID=A0ABR9CDL5_9HYPH|nr:hypothetical protein [Roseibium polysiphoniae]